MKLVGRVPVEPLDDERLTNIERRVVAGAADAPARPLRASRPFLGIAAAAACALAAGVIGWKLGGAPARGGGPAVDTAPLAIATDADGGTLSIGDATIHSDPRTQFVVTRPEGGVRVDLARGKVELEVAKRGDRPPLVVHAGDTDVIVVGTHFSVDFGDGTGEVAVRVTEGVVKVVRQQHEARVAAGQAWLAARGVIALADASVPARGATETVVAVVVPVGGAEGAQRAGGGGSGSSGYEIDMGNPPDVLHDRVAHVPDGRTPTTHPTTTTSGSAAKPDARTTGTNPPPGTGSAALDLRTLIRQQPVEPALEIGEPVAATAVAKYRQMLATSRGAEASRALYSIAVLQHAKLGRNGDALATLDMYMRRFVSGAEYPAALWLRVRILCGATITSAPPPALLRTPRSWGLRIDERCRQAAYTYAHQAPGTTAAHVAELITISE